MQLFHGTSTKNARAIQKAGVLARPYLTSCCEQAAYYAECASEEDDSDPVVLQLEIGSDALAVDYISFAEPLTIFRNKWAQSEEEWHEKISRREIPFPSDELDVATALAVTGAVRAIRDLPLEQAWRWLSDN